MQSHGKGSFRAQVVGASFIGVTLIGAFATSVNASADPTPSARAAKLEAEIADQLRRAPGGKVINDQQVSYNNGTVIATMPSASARGLNDCPSGWYCVWALRGWAGARYQFRSQGYWQNLDDYGVPWFYSFYNRRSNRVFIAPYQGQPSKCYQAGTRVSDSTNVRHYRLIYLAESNNPC